MSQPKFAVGEVVILQSKSHPHLNGEYSVSLCVPSGAHYSCRSTGDLCRNKNSIGYRLDGVLEVDPLGHERLVSECALRKRHQPGEYSWQDLKTRLVLPVSRDELARLGREIAHG